MYINGSSIYKQEALNKTKLLILFLTPIYILILMKGKKESEFFVKLISKDEKEVTLNSKYIIKSDEELF